MTNAHGGQGSARASPPREPNPAPNAIQCPMPAEPLPHRSLDAQKRPYFLWDCDLSLAELETMLQDDDPSIRGYWAGKVMRQARPEDALALISPATMAAEWPVIRRNLGRQRDFWAWLLERWGHSCTAA